jgi:hypothetical protein
MMPDELILCPKCNAAMEEGFIMEAWSECNENSQWVEGALDRNWRGAIKNMSKRKKFHVTTYRCAGRGYLESYALLDFKPGSP